MNFHPIQLNFAAFINNSNLSDIKLKATVFNETKFINSDHDDQETMNVDIKQEHELNGSLDDDDNDKQDGNGDGLIFCHWDLLRARCIVFDLLFHAMAAQKTCNLPTNDIFVDMESNTIHFNVSYDALLIVVKYIYTGVTRRYDYDDIATARFVVQLANLLHLKQLRVHINGQFVTSRKWIKEKNNEITNDLDGWRAMKLDTFDFGAWSFLNQKNFLNTNVLYHFDEKMYAKFGSRQLLKINDRIFQISKIIFVSVSKYFEAMFSKKIWKESSIKNDIIEMKQINDSDFENLQRFLYSFDQSIYYDVEHGRLNELDFEKETESKYSQKKKKLLNDTIKAFHQSIFFQIDDLRQCLLFIIEKYYLCKSTLWPFWNLGFEFELKDVKELCSNYFSKDFGNISSDKQLFHSLTKNMIKSGLSNGKIQVSTDHMIRVLLNWAAFNQTNIQELLPPNTLFNQANKSFVLSNRRPMNLQHLLRL